MKSRIRLIAVIGGAAVLLVAIVILIVHAVNSAAARIEPVSPEAALERYENAIEIFSSAKDYCLTITSTKNTSVDDTVYSVTRQQKLTYSDMGTEDMKAFSEETMTIGRKETAITETFANNIGFVTVNGAAFFSEMSADAFIDRYAPAIVIDMALYKAVSATQNRDGMYIKLEESTEPESWVLPEGAQMRTSSGAILLDAAGHLKTSTYNIEYFYGNASVNLTVTVEIEIISDPEITVPSKRDCVPAAVIDTPRILETVYSYLLQSDNITASAEESINCQASGIQRVQKTALSMKNATSDLAATFDTNIDIVDYSDGGDTSTYTQLESFSNNVYTISHDGGATTQQENVSAQQMLNYCQDFLVKNVILPDNISAVSMTEQDGTYTLQISGTEALAQVICQNVCKTLYNDPELLNSLASSYKTQKISCYFTLDKYSGLPISAGLDYSGEHTIEGFVYTLTYLGKITYNAAEQPVPTPENTSNN